MKTLHRQPISVGSPNIKYNVFNQSTWKGLNTNKNYYDIDPESFEIADNVYVDDKNVLKSRPAVKRINDELLSRIAENSDAHGEYNILKTWSFNDLNIYYNEYTNGTIVGQFHLWHKGAYKLIRLDYLPVNVKILYLQNILYIFSDSANLSAYDLSNDAPMPIANPTYNPITKTYTNMIADDYQSKNLLNNKEIHRYLYGGNSKINSLEFENKNVTVYINDERHDMLFKIGLEKLFTLKRGDISNFYAKNNDWFGTQTTLGVAEPQVKPLISISDNKVIIACEYESDVACNIYVSYDSVNFEYFDTVNDFYTIPKITKNGLYVYYVREDGVYIKSITTTQSEETLIPDWQCITSQNIVHDGGTKPALKVKIEHVDEDIKNRFVDCIVFDANAYALIYAADPYKYDGNVYLDYGGNPYFQRMYVVLCFKGEERYLDIDFHNDDELFDDTGFCSNRPDFDAWLTNDDIFFSINYTIVYNIGDFDFAAYNDNISNLFPNPPRAHCKFNLIGFKTYYDVYYIVNNYESREDLDCGYIYHIRCKYEDGDMQSMSRVSRYRDAHLFHYDSESSSYDPGFSITKFSQTKWYDNSLLFFDANNSIKYIADISRDSSVKDGYFVYIDPLYNYNDVIDYNDTLYAVVGTTLHNNNYNEHEIIYIDVLIENENVNNVPDLFAQTTTLNVAIDNKLYIGENQYDDLTHEFKLYIPDVAAKEFDVDISAIYPLSATQLAIFLPDEIWYTDYTDNGYVINKSKLHIGCKKGDDVVTSFDGKYTIFPSQLGLTALSYQDFVASTEQTATYLSDNIFAEFEEFNKKPVKLRLHKYWLYCYNTSVDSNTSEMYVFDFRTNSWWHWLFRNALADMLVTDEIELMFKNKIGSAQRFGFDYEAANYADCVIQSRPDALFNPKETSDRIKFLHVIWTMRSQKLNFGSLTNNKQIVNIVLNALQENDAPISMRLKTINYRKIVNEKDNVTLEYDIDVLRTFVKRLNYYKVNHFQYELRFDNANKQPIPLCIDNVSIKYRITEQVR